LLILKVSIIITLSVLSSLLLESIIKIGYILEQFGGLGQILK